MAAVSLNRPPAMSLVGNLGANWKRFRRDLEDFLKAGKQHNEPAEVKAAILRNIMGPEARDVLDTLTLPTVEAVQNEEGEDVEQPIDEYNGILRAFETYVKPRKFEAYERRKFNERVQKENEPFDTWYTDLKKLISTCEYGDLKDSLLRDRIMMGTNNAKLKEALFNNPDLDLEAVVTRCRQAERSKEQFQEMTSSQSSVSVDAVRSTNYRKGRGNRRGKPTRGGSHQQPHAQHPSTQQWGNQGQPPTEAYDCKKCGTRHKARNCPAHNTRCSVCNELHHWAVGCRHRSTSRRVGSVGASTASNESAVHQEIGASELLYLDVSKVQLVKSETGLRQRSECWYKNVRIEGEFVNIKLDPGSEANVLPLEIVERMGLVCELRSDEAVCLKAFNNTVTKPLGFVDLQCFARNKGINREFVIVKDNVTPLLSGEACVALGLIQRIPVGATEVESPQITLCDNKVDTEGEQILVKAKSLQIGYDNATDVFSGLGKVPQKAVIKLKQNAVPKVHPPRRVAFRLVDRLHKLFLQLLSQGIIVRVVEPSEWVHNLVIAEKPNGNHRVCLDTQELNEYMIRLVHLIPALEDVAAELHNKKFFSVFDFKDGFWQFELDEKSSHLCTFSSPFGCFRFTRMPFGISNAPELCQKASDENFGDINGVCIVIDDIIVAAESLAEHDRIVKQVMSRAREKNVRFNPRKVQYRVNQVEYLGQIFSARGMEPDPARIKALTAIKAPRNGEELESVLGMFNYLRAYIPNMSSIVEPLRELRCNKTAWCWMKAHEDAYNKLKDTVSKAPVLTSFDPNKPVIIQCDASKAGLGAVLLQEYPPHVKPVVFRRALGILR